MNIYEAMQARTRVQPAIRRRAWDYWLMVGNEKRPMVMRPKYRIIPTNTPEGCLIDSLTNTTLLAGWSPTEADLLADDWETA